MRRVLGYDGARPIWSENVPSENVGWHAHIGGQAIVPQQAKRGEPMSDQAIRQRERRAREKAQA